MRAHIEAGNMLGLYTVMLEDGRVFHDRDAFQVKDMIDRMGLVEVSSRKERAARITEIVRRELGEGLHVEWTAQSDIVVLTCDFGGRTHTTTLAPLEDEVLAAEQWCVQILADA